jgi:hypothetical protein
LDGVGLEWLVYGGRLIGNLAGDTRLGVLVTTGVQSSVEGYGACGRARPRDGASYRRGLEHERGVERPVESTGTRGVRGAVRVRSVEVEHVEDRFCPCPSVCLAALACLSRQRSRVGSLPCTKSWLFHVSPEL